MSNELTISENSGAAPGGPATSEGGAGGSGQGGFASLPPNATRKAEIEAIMRTEFDRYESEGLDKEYRALLQGEIEAVDPEAGNPTAPMPAEASRMVLCSSLEGQKLVYEWERMGGFRTVLANVQKDVGEIVRQAGNNLRQRHFMEIFSQSVPVGAEIAMMDEIASGAPTFVVPASQSEIDRFKATPAGAVLVREWGSDAAEAVAILRTRAKRLNDAMDEDDAHEFWFWLDGLEPPQAAAIFRKMAR